MASAPRPLGSSTTTQEPALTSRIACARRRSALSTGTSAASTLLRMKRTRKHRPPTLHAPVRRRRNHPAFTSQDLLDDWTLAVRNHPACRLNPLLPPTPTPKKSCACLPQSLRLEAARRHHAMRQQ
eukprot:6211745-Pleurochrysis_carterae.AAC.6